MLVAAAVVALVVGAATACTPDPQPTPTPTGFASESEAFAAAEATYRAYIDALNQVDLSDPATFEPVFALTTGDANAADRESFSQMHADGWQVSGATEIILVEPHSVGNASLSSVDLAVCSDVHDVGLVDKSGASVVSSDRPDIQSELVTLVASTNGDHALQISSFQARTGEPACE